MLVAVVKLFLDHGELSGFKGRDRDPAPRLGASDQRGVHQLQHRALAEGVASNPESDERLLRSNDPTGMGLQPDSSCHVQISAVAMTTEDATNRTVKAPPKTGQNAAPGGISRHRPGGI